MNQDSFITVDGVWKSFDAHAVLRGISLNVAAHSATVLIGASGSGKSTLLRCINALETVDAGSIVVDQELDVTAFDADFDAIRRRIGIVFQSYNLFPHMKVLENITLGPIRVLKNLGKSPLIQPWNYSRGLDLRPKHMITPIAYRVVKPSGWRLSER